MGAASPVLVRITREVEEEIRIFAVTTEEAEQKAKAMPDVARVLGSRWEPYEDSEPAACSRNGGSND